MAAGKINLQKASGGITKISSVDGTGVTELMVPESGNLVSVDTAVTDNNIARYDGTTGKLQNSGVSIDDSGNLLLTSGTGALGYGAGAGGTVTQLTSKSTSVTLNKPSGIINTHDESLATGATVTFQVFNSLVKAGDTVIVTNYSWGAYNIRVGYVTNGSFGVYITQTGATYSQAIPIAYTVVKGSNA